MSMFSPEETEAPEAGPAGAVEDYLDGEGPKGRGLPSCLLRLGSSALTVAGTLVSGATAYGVLTHQVPTQVALIGLLVGAGMTSTGMGGLNAASVLERMQRKERD